MWHPTFGWGSVIHSDFFKLRSYSAYPEWWLCCCRRRQCIWTMRHPAFEWGNDVHPDFCRWEAYSAYPEWWLCCCRRRQCIWTMQHSLASAGNLLHHGCDTWQRCSFTTRIRAWMTSPWYAPLCLGKNASVWPWKELMQPGRRTKGLPVTWMSTSQISSSFCQMGSCWPKSAVQIQGPQSLRWVKVLTARNSHRS